MEINYLKLRSFYVGSMVMAIFKYANPDYINFLTEEINKECKHLLPFCEGFYNDFFDVKLLEFFDINRESFNFILDKFDDYLKSKNKVLHFNFDKINKFLGKLYPNFNFEYETHRFILDRSHRWSNLKLLENYIDEI